MAHPNHDTITQPSRHFNVYPVIGSPAIQQTGTH